jgi:hypothetical protein
LRRVRYRDANALGCIPGASVPARPFPEREPAVRRRHEAGATPVCFAIQALNEEAAIAVHREAHGRVADSLTEVTEGA